ncbi:MAG: glycosyltransferase, partial [Sphingobacteriaceae bacterium]
NPYHLSTWFGALIARLRGKKVYYWMHGIYSDRLSAVDYIKILFYKIAHGYFLYGNRAFRRLAELKVKPSHDMHVIYNSLDYDQSVNLRKSISTLEIQTFRGNYFKNTNLPVAMFIGRVNIIKRIDLVIEAQRLLLDKGIPFNFLVVGDGEERKNSEELASKLGVSDYVSFYGASYDEAVNSYLIAASDLCVTPGEVGLTAIHAMSYGTPVVSHDNFNVQMPEVEAIKPGKTGDFFTQDNAKSLADIIEQWFKEHPYKTEELKNDCYKIVDDFFNPNYQADKLREVLAGNK